MNKRHLLGLLALVPMVWLAGCGGSSGGNASVRLVNASAGYASLDLYINDAKVTTSSVTVGAGSAFADASSGTVTTALAASSSATYLLSQSRNFAKDTKYTVVAYGWQGAPRSVVLTENIVADTSATPKAKISVLNTATDAGALNVYLTGSTDDLAGAQPVATSITGGSQSSYGAVLPGTYRLRVTSNLDVSDVRLDVPAVTLASGEVDTLVLSAGAGGILVNAAQIVQGGNVTAHNNTQARVRVVSALTGTGDKTSLTLNGAALVSNTASPTIGDYSLVSAGAATIGGTATGTATLAPGSDSTLLVLGTAAAPSLAVITDDNRLPTSATSAKLRLVNAMEPVGMASYSLTMTLNYGSVATNLLPGTGSKYKEVTPVTASTIEVSSAFRPAPMVTKDANVTLAAQGVYTFYMFGDAGNGGAGAWNGQLRQDR